MADITIKVKIPVTVKPGCRPQRLSYQRRQKHPRRFTKRYQPLSCFPTVKEEEDVSRTSCRKLTTDSKLLTSERFHIESAVIYDIDFIADKAILVYIVALAKLPDGKLSSAGVYLQLTSAQTAELARRVDVCLMRTLATGQHMAEDCT